MTTTPTLWRSEQQIGKFYRVDTSGSDGGFNIVYEQGDGYQFDIYDISGNLFATLPVTGSFNELLKIQNQSVVLPDGNTAAVLSRYDSATDTRYIDFSVSDGDGNQVVAEKSIAQTPLASFPCITLLQNGNIVVGWQDIQDQRMYFKIIDQTGSDVTTIRFVPEPYGILPLLRPLPDGGFVMAWSSYEGQELDGTIDGDVALQRFDASGNPIGDRYTIDKPGDQVLSDFNVTSDGRIVVVYNTETGDSTNESYNAFVIVDPRDSTIQGTNGSDRIIARKEDTVINGLSGDDYLVGQEFDDVLVGGSGSDILDGRAGGDVLIGGDNDDSYYVDSLDDVVSEKSSANGGIDRIYSSISIGSLSANVENLTLIGTGNLIGVGNTLDNEIVGNGGNNRLDGAAGADTLRGGDGNDTYLVDDAGDRVFEAEDDGTDAVAAAVSYTLVAGQEIEELRVALAARWSDIDLTGNEFAQTIRGNGGTNRLDGGGGADTLIGGDGNDVYFVDHAGDHVSEFKDNGRDSVVTSKSYTLTAGQEIEELRILQSVGDRAINLTGNALAQSLLGNNGANVLNGAWGNDILAGRGGADTFVFANALGSNNVDSITDFASVDTIRLSKSIFTVLAAGELDPGAFKNISTGTADASDRILYKQTTGELFYDADGSGGGTAVKFAVLVNKAGLTAADFLVV